jgi:hypothetical protein
MSKCYDTEQIAEFLKMLKGVSSEPCNNMHLRFLECKNKNMCDSAHGIEFNHTVNPYLLFQLTQGVLKLHIRNKSKYSDIDLNTACMHCVDLLSQGNKYPWVLIHDSFRNKMLVARLDNMVHMGTNHIASSGKTYIIDTKSSFF